MPRNFILRTLPFNKQQINFSIDDHYDPLNIVNEGGQSHVIRALDINSQQLVAMKKLKNVNNPDDAKRLYREFMISRSVQHRNLITLLDAFVTPNESDFYLVYEFMDGSMRDLMWLLETDPRKLKNKVWNPKGGDYFTADILFQLFCGLRYLHQDKLKFIHRDIKPENILFKQKAGGTYVWKICDLGLARHIGGGESSISMYVVTWPYRAPEIMLSSSYSFPVDLWSVGCILAEMITGDIFFKREHQNQRDHFFRILYVVGFPEGTVFPAFINREFDNAPGVYGRNRINELFPDEKLPNWINQIITKQFIRDLLKSLLTFDPNMRITAQHGVNLAAFNFLENRFGINDDAKAPYNLNEKTLPQTAEELKALIKTELDKYEVEKSERLDSQWM